MIDYYWKTVNKINLSSQYDLYEFGVANPHTNHSSTRQILQCCRDNDIQFSTYRGFDSFIGLPELTKKDDLELCKQLEWYKGRFSAKDFYSKDSDGLQHNISRDSFPVLETVEQIVEHQTTEFNKLINRNQKIIFTPGYYEDTLPTIDVSDFKPALVAHVDCDIYSSAFQVLDFLYKNDLIVDQTFILFDDWHCTDESTGEKLAFKEIRKKYPYFDYDVEGYDGNPSKGFRAIKKV